MRILNEPGKFMDASTEIDLLNLLTQILEELKKQTKHLESLKGALENR